MLSVYITIKMFNLYTKYPWSAFTDLLMCTYSIMEEPIQFGVEDNVVNQEDKLHLLCRTILQLQLNYTIFTNVFAPLLCV